MSSPPNGLYACRPAVQQAGAGEAETDGRRTAVVGIDGQEVPFRGTHWTPNPAAFEARSRRALELAAEVAELRRRAGDEDADAQVVFSEAAAYVDHRTGRASATRCNPATLSPGRLDNAIVDLLAMKKAAEQAIAERERKRAPAPPRQPRGEPVPEPDI